tara:strand:+ start:73 stop:1878 length:1806 start_codon:yes stop_codon:yes gene_type:complete
MCSPKENSEPKKRYDRRKLNDSDDQVTPEQIRSELNHCEQISNNEERVEEQVYDYENRLKQQYRRLQDQALIAKATSSLRNQLLQRELQRETRPLQEIETEDRKLINMTFVISLSVILIFVIAALMNADQIETVAAQIRSSTIANLSWFYLLASTSFLLFIVYLGFSRFGNVVLGNPNEKPEFSDLSWAAMLFAAGMGSGLLFWGGAEPLLHYTSPPVGEPRTSQAGSMAMTYTALHWCLHGWGIYTVGALAVAYFGFRRRKKYLVSSCIPELFASSKLQTALRAFCDISATLAVIFGMGASLGMGTEQFAKGLNLVYEIPLNGVNLQIMVLAAVTILFLISATTGLDKGIKILSNLNIIVAILLMIFVFLVGPKLFMLKLFVDSIGKYINEIFVLSFQTLPMVPSYEKWMGNWTINYFAWWIAWAPFVGIFLARISKGRTIRQLVVGSLIIPTVFSLMWFATFGGAAIHLDMNGFTQLASQVKTDSAAALFLLLQQFPLETLTSTVSLFLILVFLVTSADSATFVIAMMTSEGDLDPSLRMKIVWGIVMSLVTMVLILGGGLGAIQAAALLFALPFTFVLILMMISLWLRLGHQVESQRI